MRSHPLCGKEHPGYGCNGDVRRSDGRRYFNKETVGLDFEGMKADIKVGFDAHDRESCSV
jgi:hypothetical protein